MPWSNASYGILRYLRDHREGARQPPFSAQTFGMSSEAFLGLVCFLAESGYITGVNYVFNNGQRYVQSIIPQITTSGLHYLEQYEQQVQMQRFYPAQPAEHAIKTGAERSGSARVLIIAVIVAVVVFALLFLIAVILGSSSINEESAFVDRATASNGENAYTASSDSLGEIDMLGNEIVALVKESAMSSALITANKDDSGLYHVVLIDVDSLGKPGSGGANSAATLFGANAALVFNSGDPIIDSIDRFTASYTDSNGDIYVCETSRKDWIENTPIIHCGEHRHWQEADLS